jgi:hypothetical protein
VLSVRSIELYFFRFSVKHVNMHNTFPRRSDEALLSSLRKEMEAPRKTKSVRVADVKRAKAKHKSTLVNQAARCDR